MANLKKNYKQQSCCIVVMLSHVCTYHSVTSEILKDLYLKLLHVLQIWMLTGDKLETATCIAKSSRLVSRTQSLHVFKSVVTRTDAHLELNTFRKKQDCALVISGDSLEVSDRVPRPLFIGIV